ncbi:MAG: serine/threonine-protein phosphatase, partial [Erysipelotrichaceae bacterium]
MKLLTETYFASLNKKNEELCGDKVKFVRNEEACIAVLADGLGSGVKANILATLTSEILSTMIGE